MRFQHLILIAFFLTAIEKDTIGKEIEFTSIEHTLTEKQELSTTTNTDSILIEQRAFHDFSQVGKKDEFYICIRGKSITEGKVIFKIISHDKTTILNEEFPSYLLMDYGFIGDLESEKDREKYMTNRIREFFNEKKFFYPAIKPEEHFDKDYSDKEIWDEIQSDKSAIGFSYHLGEGDGRKIAYSKKNKKAMMYFNCC